MRTEIVNNLDHPGQLEKLYRENKTTFKKEFNLIYPDISEKAVAQVWNERLRFENEEVSAVSGKELIFVLALCILAALIAKVPEIFPIEPEFFYTRNLAFVVLPLLTIYFAWKQQLQTKMAIAVSTGILASALYINLLPNNSNSDTLLLACIHLPIFLWAVLGFTFVGDKLNDHQRRQDFLRYNGDLVVMTTILLIAGGLLTAITLGLFQLIDLQIEEFYSQYIVISGLAASPIAGTYLVQTNPQLVNKVSPVIARVFTPLVLVTLVTYLIAVIYTGKDPYNDREFLLLFNLLLVGVMAIILFSIAETGKNTGRTGILLLSGLSIVTIIINGIALSAILFRITEWGITPNRLAVLGANLLMLINLLLITYRLIRTIKDEHEKEKIEKCITSFLPIYVAWTMLVIFAFPLLFNFK
ncbi:MAG: hypothetical protein IPG01_15445 [Chitinophagaceae bacterium]|nr:hypothetical protein [Chitinophagaceae bacterium]